MSNPKGKDAKGPVFIVSIIHLGQCRKMVTFHWSMNNQSGLIEFELPGREGSTDKIFVVVLFSFHLILVTEKRNQPYTSTIFLPDLPSAQRDLAPRVVRRIVI